MSMNESSRGVSRRVPRSQVRQRLIAAAAEAFTKHGYDAATVDDIALRAGFTKGAVYSNFGSKQGLFAAVLEDRSEIERDRLLRAAEIPSGEVASFVANIVAESITGDEQRSRIGLEFAARAARDAAAREAWTPLRRTQREVAERAIREVTGRSGLELTIDPEVAALVLHCLTNGLSMEHLADPEQVDSAAIELAVTTLIDAITHSGSEPRR
ncbi:TetR/AcrR family transcriptional regulator [Brevibacterium spongiae]|uniref:TetR/AcrR family transcriptional regulator n=1 Tax=Brevibacterium spongiae TaxID=2909672 RepID=A0ABY5SNF9_9MICO|nr:TetR/AcrR family transcriptional regulator [Brevibacterium spongiae]UVI36107.1 TetR/AcrR family transcriptional regulator [Brevibacterium spongiae]